jgi:Tol biopolymer transport system component
VNLRHGSRAFEGSILRRSIRAAAILAAICMVLAAGWAGPAATAQAAGTALLLSSSPSTYKLDPTTGQLSVLVANGEDAVLSPDGTRAAYVRDLDRDLCLYRDPVDSCWAFDDLLTADLSGADERAVAHTADMVHRYSPDWSPKGSRILFTWWTFDEGRGLAWVRPDGSGLETLELYAGRGRFSPDGRKVVYERDGNLKLMNLADRRTRLLTSDASSDGYAPDWSPDGRRITYTGLGGLYVLEVKTGQVRNLAAGWTAPVSYPSTAVFSPDGTQIAFAALDVSAYPEGAAVPRIYTVDATGGEPRPIADASGYLTDWVQLSPTG